MFLEKRKKLQPKPPTKVRLRNIALYYLERFESSEDNLRAVLRRRIDKYVFFDKSYNPEPAYQWIEEVIQECLARNFVNDKRFAEFKINDYLSAGKSRRYIEQKLKLKGIDEQVIADIFEQTNYSEYDSALHFAKKRKLGCFRNTNQYADFYQKDLATLVRAGFDYDIAKEIISKRTDSDA